MARASTRGTERTDRAARPLRDRDLGLALAPALAVAGGHGLSLGNHLLFYSLATGVSILVHFGAFVVAWYARGLLRQNYIFLLGAAFLLVAGLDALHVLARDDFPVLPGVTPDATGKLWLFARLLEALAFLAVAAAPRRRYRLGPLAGAGLAWLVLALGTTLAWDAFPPVLDASGAATVLGLAARVAIACLMGAALALLVSRRASFDPQVRRCLVAAALFALGGTLGQGPSPLGGFLGPAFHLLAAVFIFKGVVETGLIRPQALISMAHERQERLTAELERQSRQLDDILSATPDMVFLFDRDLRFAYANAAASEGFGVPQAAWAGCTWQDFELPPEVMAPIEVRVHAVFAAGAPYTTEVVLDGRHQECKFTPLFDVGPPQEADQPVSAVLVTCRDVTERSRGADRLRQALCLMEEARLEAERADAAKTRFLAAASHDLRQPLQAIRLLLGVLASRLTGTREAGIVAQSIDALEGCEELLRSLLDLSTLQAGTVKAEIRDFHLRTMLDRLAEECGPPARAKGLDLRVVPSSVVVRSDPVLLQRLVRNLVVNAIRYTERGRVLVGARRLPNAVRIIVYDTGLGIPDDKLDLIFEEFYQLGNEARNRSEGLGLGLSIVRKTAELLGHELWAASKVGVGSAFAVTVPLGVAAAPVPEAEPAEAEPRARSLSVLVIEDDPMQLVGLRLLLEGWGHAVTPAASAESALAAVREGCAPDLVITDFRLPGELSGIDAVGEVRMTLRRRVPAVLLTGDTDPDRLRAAKAGDLRLLHKPYLPDQLRHVMGEAMAEELV